MSSLQPFSQSSPGSRSSIPQGGMLALLPTEIIIQIAEFVDSQRESRRTFDHLMKTCSLMYVIIRPYYYRAENFLQFFDAASVANITMMERCEYFDAAPINIVWTRPTLRRFTPVELLLRNVDEGNDRQDTADRAALRDSERDKIFDALGWLLERGANGEVSMVNECFHDLDLPSGHMPSTMLVQFQVGTSQRGSEVLFNMIRMLSRYGYSNPTRHDSVSGWQCIDNAAWFTDTMSSYNTTSPLKLALKSHVMPSLLNLMLEEYEARGLRLRDWHNRCPPSLVQSASRHTDMSWRMHWLDKGPSIHWVEISYINTLVGTLHADLHNETTRWSESYSGEVADVFKAKLDIMIKHEMIDNSERALLRSIGAALYRIASIGHAAGGLGNKHFKMSWEMLWDAVRPFFQDLNLVQNPRTAPSRKGPGRIHRFAISSGWNPWKQWLLRHDARLRHRKMLASGTIKKVPTEVWESAQAYDARYISPYANYTQVPAWHTVSLDEWIAWVRSAEALPGRRALSLMAGRDDGL